MNEIFIFLIGLGDVDLVEISHMYLHQSFSNLDVDDGFFVSQRKN